MNDMTGGQSRIHVMAPVNTYFKSAFRVKILFWMDDT